MTLSFKKLFFVQAAIFISFYILFVAKEILIPVIFALLFGFILYPVIKWLKNRKIGLVWAIIMTMLTVTILVFGMLFLFSAQIVSIVKEYSGFVEKLREVLDSIVQFLNDKVGFIPNINTQTITDQFSEFFTDSGLVIVSDTIGVTSTFFSYLLLTVIYTFLILLYHEHLTKALTRFNSKKDRPAFLKMLKEVQEIGQKYLTSMLTLVLILGTLNSLGLWMIGIDYALFFGFLAAVLAIVPYVGTTLGGLIPALFALITYDSYWYPIGVIGMFWLIQFIEGNYLSPKIVGGNLNINALFSILSLIAGGLFWGIPGMILFLPMVAIFKVICSYYKELKPVALLLGDSDKSETPEEGVLSRWSKTIQSKLTDNS
ncbi:AI-2E family transporter [Reichenbachiella agarivorans]|uniref:AI-2E family transporter n=1 Tax=Reichenbachiella agarivorans TaxID=2979464 RepID=A0ABY6CJN0_9BACT|nr:AI-2E family transporter [Reichenbachiella agarivorans]UXP30687.1 AI-2E family transporter [Reichenbachiella agarivorans]